MGKEPSLEVTVVFRKGRVKSVNLPARTQVCVNDYDTDKYHKDYLEKDAQGVWCRAQVWKQFPYDAQNRPVQEIDHEVRIAVRNKKLRVQKCPKQIRVRTVENDDEVLPEH